MNLLPPILSDRCAWVTKKPYIKLQCYFIQLLYMSHSIQFFTIFFLSSVDSKQMFFLKISHSWIRIWVQQCHNHCSCYSDVYLYEMFYACLIWARRIKDCNCANKIWCRSIKKLRSILGVLSFETNQYI